MISSPQIRAITFSAGPLPPLDDLEKIWRRLDEVGVHSFFLTWAWIGTWLYQQKSLSNFILLKAIRGREVVGVSVLSCKHASIRGLLPIRQAWLNATGDPAIDCITVEHNGFASELSEDQIWPSLAQWFAAGHLGVDELILPGVRSDIPIINGNRVLFLERREAGFRTPLSRVASVGLASLLSRNGRQKLRHGMRQYERHGPLQIQAAANLGCALEYFDRMKMLHINSWTRRGQRHSFSNPFFEAFHRRLIVDHWDDRAVDLLHISAGQSTLGYLYNFLRGRTVYSYQSGFDDTSRGARPGYVSHALAIEHYAERDMEYYDFLAETNRLKLSFGFERYELCWQRLRKPTLGFRLESVARRVVGRT